MADTIYVIGHKNPDTDSVASAIAYARLKNDLMRKENADHRDLPDHVPAVLGPLNKETQFVLDYFGIEAPTRLEHIRIRAKDAMSPDVITVTPQTSLRNVGDIFYRNNIRTVPVVDKENHPRGIVTERSIAYRYFEETKVRSLAQAPLSAKRIAETLDGEIVIGSSEEIFSANVIVAAMRAETMKGYIQPGDIVIVGNREGAQAVAIREGASCLVITGQLYPSQKIGDQAQKQGTTVILTALDTFAAAKRINLSAPAQDVMQRDFLTAEDEELFFDLVDEVLNSENRLALIVDGHGRLIGIITRHDLVHPARRKAILVDHNEVSQSAPGIEEAQILEIVDHHRLGDIQIGEPILVKNEPVGATSTIVFKAYKENDAEIPKEIAGIMLAAVLSDTVLLKSPTATEDDKKVVDELGAYLGLDPVGFGIEMYRQTTDIESITARDLMLQDFKIYEFNDNKLGIGQMETIDLDSVLKRRRQMLEAMQDIVQEQSLYMVMVMVTDILQEGTELLVAGKTKLAEKVFEKKLVEGGMFLPGVISRKKQIAPLFAKVLSGK
jgi:manganese-dependent inorganic pyrophosphatase